MYNYTEKEGLNKTYHSVWNPQHQILILDRLIEQNWDEEFYYLYTNEKKKKSRSILSLEIYYVYALGEHQRNFKQDAGLLIGYRESFFFFFVMRCGKEMIC